MDGATQPDRHRTRRRRHDWAVAARRFGIPVLLVGLFLISGIPQQSLARAPSGAPVVVSFARVVAPSGISSAISTRLANPASGPGHDSLCLLQVLRACSARDAVPVPPPDLLAPSTPSSWTNITPPAGAVNPSARALASMTYDPAGHDVVLFGGATNIYPFYANDTWSFADGAWTELVSNTSCTASTCPSGRADVMLAYYAPLQAVLLFGGEISFLGFTSAYNDTWLFYADRWHNVTATAGHAPSPRFGSAMTWDALDNQVLLFGGALANGNVVGDTWAFDGTWHNLTSLVYTRSNNTVPSARAAMAIADSPSGYLLMYGGEAQGAVLWEYPPSGCLPFPVVSWWFYQDRWSPMVYLTPCIIGPRTRPPGGTGVYTNPPPCGREYAALGWSPKNLHFVLYGGFGPQFNSSATCSGPDQFLNDTWTYENPLGGAFFWRNVSDAGDPSYRYGMAYAADLTDNYFLVFGGVGAAQPYNSTYRFFALVHAALTGPSDIDTNTSHTSFGVPFTVVGYGGTGQLDYQLTLNGELTTNSLVDGGGTACVNLTQPTKTFGPLPYDGIATIACDPTAQSYNVYRLTLRVFDVLDAADVAWANWTFRVDPPETMVIDSQFAGYFYSGVSFTNRFTVDAKAAGGDASSLAVTLGGASLLFSHRGGSGPLWDAWVNMQNLGYGPQVLRATATFAGGWVLNASYTVNVIETPDWLTSIIDFPQVTQTNSTKGPGPYNENYSITEAFQWSLDKALGFNIQLPFVKGNVSLIPSLQVSLTATSTGNVTMVGSLGLTPPEINLGPATIGITVTATLKGTFTLDTQGGQIDGLTWVSASASITIAGKFGASVPIYGFNVLGIKVGFTLEVEVDAGLTLGVMLAPTTPGFEEFIPGIAVKVSEFFASLSLQLQLAVNFGIGIASIGIGGSLSVAVGFAVTRVTSSVIYITGGWINGTIFIEASFLWWSDQWNLASGTIYNWTNPPPSLPFGQDPFVRGSSATAAGYDNGSTTSWSASNRSYVGPAYDQNVWLPAESLGTAISDIYPHAKISVAASADGSYLFFTDDNASRSVSTGLTVSGLHLDGTSNALTGLPAPADPNFVIADPQASTLPDGNLFVLWDAIPTAETSVAGPTALTTVALHGAEYFPADRSWGAVRTFTDWGIAQSYAVDPSGTGSVAALVSPSWLLGPTAPERLLELDLGSGSVLHNSSVTGLGSLVAVRGALGLALARDAEGNYSTVGLATGASSPIGYSNAIGGSIVSADLVAGTPSTAVLLDRAGNRSVLALYDLGTQQTVAALPLGENVNQPEAIAGGNSLYVFVRGPHGIDGWTESGGTFENLTTIPASGVTGYAIGQDGAGIVVAYLVTSDRQSTGSTVALDLAEVGATLAPLPSPAAKSSPISSGSSGSTVDYALYLSLAAVGVAVLLAVVAVVTRRRPPAAGSGGAPVGAQTPTSPPATEGGSGQPPG
ncbi:MAG TPA: hypothetical protein VGV89_07870 [Thermoplasmata archaeon]|nr:hypothetical protein [Thermoplasmata archaeon]